MARRSATRMLQIIRRQQIIVIVEMMILILLVPVGPRLIWMIGGFRWGAHIGHYMGSVRWFRAKSLLLGQGYGIFDVGSAKSMEENSLPGNVGLEII